jgi:lysosomal Pro-X carboxypeptidase
MWTLGRSMRAFLVFAEHRYFGQSLPRLQGMPNCLAYLTSAQALADYALLVRHLKDSLQTSGAVIAFGGSYGGMLAAWARFKYPSTFAGAIAASAPIWGFPETQSALDGSFTAITRAASAAGGVAEGDRCKTNVLAAWPLIHEVGKTAAGRALLARSFRLCGDSAALPDEDAVAQLIAWAQSPWFLLAEGTCPTIA